MRRLLIVLAALTGIALPLALALAVYLASAASLAEPLAGAPLPTQTTIAEPSAAASQASKRRSQAAGAKPASLRGTDQRGRCDEPEHRSDPGCAEAAGDDRSDHDGSGKGSDFDDGRSGSGGSGSGSSGGDSGTGGGDSESGTSGSSGSGSGSSGSGDDD